METSRPSAHGYFSSQSLPSISHLFFFTPRFLFPRLLSPSILSHSPKKTCCCCRSAKKKIKAWLCVFVHSLSIANPAGILFFSLSFSLPLTHSLHLALSLSLSSFLLTTAMALDSAACLSFLFLWLKIMPSVWREQEPTAGGGIQPLKDSFNHSS